MGQYNTVSCLTAILHVMKRISARDVRVVVATFGHLWSCSVSAMASKPTRKEPFKPPSSKAKKRKSSDNNDADDNEKQPKQPKINAFFTPRVSLNTTCGTDKTTSVAKLSEEQRGVFQLVVEEGKCVFFTGSAGALSLVTAERSVTATDALTVVWTQAQENRCS